MLLFLLAYTHLCMMGFVTLCQTKYHVLAQCFCENYKGQPKSYSLPCLYSTYALLIANSDEKEVCDEIFEKLDRAVQYN